jgi:hypothetical protein
MNTKFLFLDVDGVLNTDSQLLENSIIFIDDEKVKILKYIIDKTDAKIILSSDWRINNETLCFVTKALDKYNLEIFSVTKQMIFGYRDAEIKLWLKENIKENSNSSFAIIDDCPLAEIKGHFFKTFSDIGLTKDIAENIISFLNK